MKTLKAIKNDLAKVNEAIEAKTAEIIRLDLTEERREAAQQNNMESWKKYHEKSKANAEQIARLSDEVYTLEIEKRIIAENAKAALFNEAYPVIAKACEKYSGKAYGEKTRDAIREEVKKAGFVFYFDGYGETYKINITELRDGFTRPDCVSVEGVALDENQHTAEFITKENKINIQNVSGKSRAKYTENTRKAARATAKAIRKYEEATKALEAQRRELCAMIPEGIKEPDYIKEYYVRF